MTIQKKTFWQSVEVAYDGWSQALRNMAMVNINLQNTHIWGNPKLNLKFNAAIY